MEVLKRVKLKGEKNKTIIDSIVFDTITLKNSIIIFNMIHKRVYGKYVLNIKVLHRVFTFDEHSDELEIKKEIDELLNHIFQNRELNELFLQIKEQVKKIKNYYLVYSTVTNVVTQYLIYLKTKDYEKDYPKVKKFYDIDSYILYFNPKTLIINKKSIFLPIRFNPVQNIKLKVLDEFYEKRLARVYLDYSRKDDKSFFIFALFSHKSNETSTFLPFLYILQYSTIIQ